MTTSRNLSQAPVKADGTHSRAGEAVEAGGGPLVGGGGGTVASGSTWRKGARPRHGTPEPRPEGGHLNQVNREGSTPLPPSPSLPFWTPLSADPHGVSRRLDRGWWAGYYGLALLAAQMSLAAWQVAQATREPFAHLLHQERGQGPPRDLTPRLEEDARRVRLWTQPLGE